MSILRISAVDISLDRQHERVYNVADEFCLDLRYGRYTFSKLNKQAINGYVPRVIDKLYFGEQDRISVNINSSIFVRRGTLNFSTTNNFNVMPGDILIDRIEHVSPTRGIALNVISG